MNAPITSPKVANPIIPANNEINSGDPKVFAQFLDWGTKTYPAEHTAVVLWNHGSGLFRADKNGKMTGKTVPGQISANGFGWDDHGSHMNVKDLNQIFAGAVANAGKKIDILDFDACLMAHVEVAYQIKDQVSYLVASEKTEAGDGNDYWGIMESLNKNPDQSGAEFASAMVQGYAKSYQTGGHQYTGPNEEYTLSATDTSSLANKLVPAINDLATELTSNPSSVKPAWNSATTYDGDPEPRDLGHFLKLVKQNRVSSAKADAVTSALKETVISEVHTNSSSLKDSTGLVIYFPGPGDSINPRYTNTAEFKFAEQKPWGDFLKAFTKGSRR